MVHVEKINVKGNTYYKLVHSIRKHGKVSSKSRYLGKHLPPVLELAKLKQKFYRDILKQRQLSRKQPTPSLPSAQPHPARPHPAHPAPFEHMESSLRSLLDAMPDVAYLADPQTFAIKYINARVQTMFGYPASAWKKDPHFFQELIHKPDLKRVMGLYMKVMQQKKIVDLTYRMRTKQGKMLWVAHSIIPCKDAAENPLMFIGYFRDITQRKESRDEAKEIYESAPVAMLNQDFSAVKAALTKLNIPSPNRMRFYLQHHPDEVKKLAALVRVNSLNPQTLKLFKARSNEAFLETYHDRNFFRDSYKVFVEELVAVASNKQKFESNLSIFSLDGRRHQITLKWAVPASNIQTYEKVLINFIDTSMQRTLTKVMDIKNYALESSLTGILITDLEGHITYANDAFLELWNMPEGSLHEKKVENFLSGDQKNMKILHALHKFHFWRGHFQIPADKPRYVELSASLVRDQYNEPLGMVFSYMDITDHVTSENIRLEFTNVAAHELKTPLVPIKTFMALMKSSPKKFGINKEGMKIIDVCLRNTDRLSELVGDILDISRLEAGGMKFQMGIFDLSKVVKNAASDFLQQANQKGINLRTSIKKLPQLKGDEARIAQVIGNLLKNAISFTSNGNIFIEAFPEKGKAVVKVIDTGNGIAASDLDKIFGKFYQAQDITTRSTHGSGLGLPICQKIILAHKGSIYASSEGIGKGSTFTIELPIGSAPVISKFEGKKKKSSRIDDLTLLGNTGSSLKTPPFKPALPSKKVPKA